MGDSSGCNRVIEKEREAKHEVMRKSMPDGDQNELQTSMDVTYQIQADRYRWKRTRQRAKLCDSEDFWHLALSGVDCAVGAIGPRVWITTV